VKDFGIVIPYLNSGKYLSTALMSIVNQEGESTAHVHIQDGGKESLAQTIIDKAIQIADSSRFTFSYARAPDKNAAEAINRGMDLIEAETLTWIGADDFFFPGAFEAVMSLRQKHPHIQWVTGLPHLVSPSGVGLPSYGSAGFYRHTHGFSQEGLRRGLHAGELNHGWIQQEGTFWSRSVWEQVGGLNDELRLAFDFDLWSRMAEHATLVEVMMPFAAFRKHPAQASSDMSGYLDEARIVAREIGKREEMATTQHRIIEETWTAYFSKDSLQWNLIRKSFVLWIPWSRKPFSLPGLSNLRFTAARGLRAATPGRLYLRPLLMLAGRVRRLLNKS